MKRKLRGKMIHMDTGFVFACVFIVLITARSRHVSLGRVFFP